MRRLIVLFAVALLAMPLLAAVAPADVHAQTATPTVSVQPNPVQAGSSATVSGTGFTANYYAYVFWQRPDGTTNAVNVGTDPSGHFAFTLGFDAAHGTGTEYLRAYDYATGRWSNTVSITVTGSSPPPPATRQLSSDRASVTPGQIATVTGMGFTPMNYVYLMYTRPDGTSNAVYEQTDSTGRFDQQFGFLRSHGCGPERFQAYDYGTRTWSNVLTITVTGC
jgi:hypothetical protein